jgi:hypothetical protein
MYEEIPLFIKKSDHVLIMTFPPPQPKQKYTPHNTLEEGWTYVSVPDDDVVIAVKVAVTKVMKLVDQNDQPIKDQNTGVPAYFFQSTNVVKVLSAAEYNVEKQMQKKKGYGT